MNADDRKNLLRHHYATIGLFITFWLYTLIVIFLIELFPLSPTTQHRLMGVVFGAVFVLCVVQLTKRCPDCKANLGLQRRLGIPRHCAKCRAVLRTPRHDDIG